jgi:RNA ligase (TIGR02306 family)
MSTHKVEVVRINEIVKHPNADRLEIVTIYGFNCCVGKDQFRKGDLAIYVEPDYVLPDKPEYAFLKGNLRIKSRRFRGEWSQGLLLPVLEGMKEGDNVMEQLEILRYNPPEVSIKGGKILRGQEAKAPSILKSIRTYDLENWRRYEKCFTEGEQVYITEKIHGANARFSYQEGKLWAGSRNQWKKNPKKTKFEVMVEDLKYFFRFLNPKWSIRKTIPKCTWWSVAEANPWIENWCKNNPDYVLFGEVYGNVQDLKYGATKEQLFFRAFDAFNLKTQKFMDAVDFVQEFPEDKRAPLIYMGEYSKELCLKLALMEKSTLADHIGEGIVIKPVEERIDPRVGRVALKLVSDLYLERS